MENVPVWVNEKEASDITKRAIQTLRNDRFAGKGIPYYKVGRSVRYRLEDIINYMEARKIPTEDMELMS